MAAEKACSESSGEKMLRNHDRNRDHDGRKNHHHIAEARGSPVGGYPRDSLQKPDHQAEATKKPNDAEGRIEMNQAEADQRRFAGTRQYSLFPDDSNRDRESQRRGAKPPKPQVARQRTLHTADSSSDLP